MKRLIINLLFTTPLVATAQHTVPAQIHATYDYNVVRRHIEGHDFIVTTPMVLLASSAGSRFYDANTERYDSLMASPGGHEQYNAMLKAAAPTAVTMSADGFHVDMSKINIPRRGTRLQVERPDGSDTLTVVAFVAQEEMRYTVPMNELEWTIADSTKTVLGYECQQATADYHGRHWTAWFAPEVAVSSGPWQLAGLPGLIMEATTEGKEYSFVITGLEATDRPINPRPGEHTYTNTTRKEMLRLQHEIRLNPAKAFPDGSVKVGNSRESAEAAAAHDLIETDYR